MTSRLPSYSKRLSSIFAGADRYRAHEQARLILAEMVEEREVLADIVSQNLSDRDFFERTRVNPVIALRVAEDSNYCLIANLWIPLDDRSTELTHQSVHHHGSMLLTSMSAWGTGYESLLFKSGFRVIDADGTTAMELDKFYKNPMGHAEFVPTHTPHVVLFPSSLTVTYALWSGERRQVATSWVRRIPGIGAYKKRLRDGLHRLGLASALRLNVVENLDFCVQGGHLVQMKARALYPAGTRANYLDNFFWCLQELRFDRLRLLAERVRSASGEAHEQAAELLRRLEQGDTLEHRMDRAHLRVDKAQLSRASLAACFPALSTAPTAP